VAERLKSEIEAQPLILDGMGSVQVRVSGGVATQTPDSPPETDLFDLADRELIKAKRQGQEPDRQELMAPEDAGSSLVGMCPQPL